jgi:RNA recognition motif-containing protein
MKKMFVGNLARSVTEADVRALFSQHGTVRSVKLVSDVFSGECKGFGFVEMEGHEARAAMTGLDGADFQGRPLKVREEVANRKTRGRQRRH